VSDVKRKAQSTSYAVGYRRPPVHTRFRRGVSGNPGGRPRGRGTGRANALILKEAYRLVTVRDGENVLTLPAIQAVLRSLVARAAKGSGPAQRALIAAVIAIEQQRAAEAMTGDNGQHLQITWLPPADAMKSRWP
jgi:Family of unknown function (DUF5681)